MRGGARLGWRVATAVVFGATAALSVIVSRGAPMNASLTSAKGADGGHAAASASVAPAVTPQCAISRLRLSVGPGVRVAAQITRGIPGKAAKPTGTTPTGAKPTGGKRGETAVAALIRYRLDFTNVSRLPCTMTGYPQVAADRDGVLVGGEAAHDTTVVAHRLLLAPGQTVHAALDAMVPTPRCHPVRASGLRVAPPGQSSGRDVHRPLTACTARGQVYLHVRAVQAGAGAPRGVPASTPAAEG
ncbi:MAG TPA: DUF4232 domain-containing protein [Trebonia sp.]|nr:DUF4232 domain-containing protein [Trebonia sp.]